MNAVHSTIRPQDSVDRAEAESEWGTVEASVERLRQLESRAAVRSEARRALTDRRGRLSARARLAALLDPGRDYLPLYNMASYLVDSAEPLKSLPGASLLGGIGFVSGVRCVVAVDDGGINAGALTAKTAQKLLGLIRVAEQQKLPFVHLMDSVGPELLRQDAVQWDALEQVFTALAQRAGKDVPVISVLHGPSIGAVALFVGLSDHVIAVEDEAMAMLAGAAQVRAVTGEIARDAALGGAALHAEVTGLVDQLASSDEDAISRARDAVKTLGRTVEEQIPRNDAADMDAPEFENGRVKIESLAQSLVDAGELRSFKPGFGAACHCLTGQIWGQQVALVATSGTLDTDCVHKAIEFLERAGQANTPVVFLQDCQGFEMGRQAERAGIVKLAARLSRTVASLPVPRIVLRVGESLGPAGFAFGGLAGSLAGGVQGVDFLFSWPTAQSGIMAAQEAALTMDQVARRSAARRSLAVDERRLGDQRDRLAKHIADQLEALTVSGQGLDMGVIDPRDSRRIVGFCLETTLQGRKRRVEG